MSAKLVDQQGRWRNVTVGFRMSPEEVKLLDSCVAVSGLTKQDYITSKLLNKDVIVTPNPRVFKHLKIEIANLCKELERLDKASDMTDEQVCLMCVFAAILKGMGGENSAK